MSYDEKLILGYLEQFADEFVSAVNIARRADTPRRYRTEPGWAREVLRRLEIESVVEKDFMGRYRLKQKCAKVVRDRKQTVPQETVPELRVLESVKVCDYSWPGLSVVQADDDQPFATILESLVSSWPSDEELKAA